MVIFNKNTSRLVFPVMALVLSAFLFSGCNQETNRQTNRGSGGGEAAVEAQVIQPQELFNRIFTTGTLLANEEVELRSEISGRVTGVFFEEGQRVNKGKLLLKINDRELQAQLRRKEVEEKQASDEERRQRRLFEIKVISQEEYDKTFNNLKMIQAEKEAVESQLSETEITAPFDGVIGLRYVSEGGYVNSNVLVATMQDTDPMKVEFAVPEKHARQLKNATEILVRIGDSHETYQGIIYAIESKIEPDTRTIKARAKIPSPGTELIPGAFAKVEIVLEKYPEAIVIPSEAIIPEISGEKVFIYENGKAKSVPVTTGLRTDKSVQITQGLNTNDTLIVSGLLQLTDGKAVQIKALRDK